MVEIADFTMTRATGCPLDPAPALSEYLQKGPMRRVRLWDGSTPWLVAGYAEQRALLADPRVSSVPASPGFPNFTNAFAASGFSFVVRDDPEHNRLRRTVIAQFTVKRAEAMRPRVQEIVDEQLDRMLAGPKPADLVEAFALPVPSLVICELLGVPYADHDMFQATSGAILHQETTPEGRAAAAGALYQYIDTLIGARFAEPGDDLLSELTERISAGELTRPEAAEIGVLVLLAGFGFGVHQCLGQPLARIELQTVYRTLLERAPNLELAAGLDEIPFKHDGFVYGLYRLPVTW